MKTKKCLLIALSCSVFLSLGVPLCSGQDRGELSFHLENDVFSGTDRYYTHGIQLSWIFPIRTASLSDPSASQAFSFSLGQGIYTPYEIEREDLIENDRPYAGLFYFTLALHKKRGQTMDTFEFLLGQVGPSSLGEQIQRFIHSLYGGTQPRGWKHQLRDQVVFDFVFDKKWRIFRTKSGKNMEYDLIGHVGGSLGTMTVAAATGWQFRFGSNLPQDFGTHLLRPGGESGTLLGRQNGHSAAGHSSGVHGFVYLVGHAIYGNIFLDGNTFKESCRVEKNSFVGDVALGFVIRRKRFRFSYAYFFRTKQFKAQVKPHSYGAINISYVY